MRRSFGRSCVSYEIGKWLLNNAVSSQLSAGDAALVFGSLILRLPSLGYDLFWAIDEWLQLLRDHDLLLAGGDDILD